MNSQIIIKLEQIRRGYLYLMSLKDRKVTSVNIYATSRCNGRCRICHIWKKKNNEDIALGTIKNILKCENPGTQYFLSGGEFIMHPQYEEILNLFRDKNYILLSNGILSKRLLETVKKYKVRRVVLSFDGLGKTYAKVRGIDNFDNLHELIHQLNKICNVSLNYTINPLNDTFREISAANKFANEHRVYLALGIYDTPEYFDTSLSRTKLPSKLPKRPYPLNKYLTLYNKWLNGQVKIPCLGIRNSCTVFPNGDVSLCYGKNIIIGNIVKKSLKEIWESKKTQKKQDKYVTCTKCWLICQKPMDIFIWDIINLLPKRLIPANFKNISEK